LLCISIPGVVSCSLQPWSQTQEESMIITRPRRTWAILAAIPAVLLLFTPLRLTPQDPANSQVNTCTVDADGTAHVTRVVPVPQTISPEAQKFISRLQYGC
jgi:hypothetical protein